MQILPSLVWLSGLSVSLQKVAGPIPGQGTCPSLLLPSFSQSMYAHTLGNPVKILTALILLPPSKPAGPKGRTLQFTLPFRPSPQSLLQSWLHKNFAQRLSNGHFIQPPSESPPFHIPSNLPLIMKPSS